MAYHPLTNESGGDENSRINEARKIVEMLEVCYEEMKANEQSFVNQMADTDCERCSVKQLFWLRDIKDKYL